MYNYKKRKFYSNWSPYALSRRKKNFEILMGDEYNPSVTFSRKMYENQKDETRRKKFLEGKNIFF